MNFCIYILILISTNVFAKTIKSNLTTINVVAPSIPGTSTLSKSATNLQVGQWSLVNKAGDGSNWNAALTWVGSDTILNYADKGLWDPYKKEIHFLGKGAGGAEFKMISYDEATNHWVQQPKPYWDNSGGSASTYGHGYEHSTINPATGDVFWRPYNGTSVYKWARATKIWSEISNAPNIGIVGAIEYFPEAGGFVLVGDGKIYFYKESTGAFTQVSTGLDMGQGYHTVASYNPVHKVIICGGGNGNSKLYKISASLQAISIASAPVNVGITASVFTVDPVSGKHLLLSSTGQFYEYNVTTNTWATVNSSAIPIWANDSNKIIFTVAVPMKSLGVIAFLTGYYNSDAAAKVYIYKHSQ